MCTLSSNQVSVPLLPCGLSHSTPECDLPLCMPSPARLSSPPTKVSFNFARLTGDQAQTSSELRIACQPEDRNSDFPLVSYSLGFASQAIDSSLLSAPAARSARSSAPDPSSSRSLSPRRPQSDCLTGSMRPPIPNRLFLHLPAWQEMLAYISLPNYQLARECTGSICECKWKNW